MNAQNNADQNGVEILVVEDSSTQAEQLRYILDQQDYRVSLAKNGRQALEILSEHKPALVISDINMPEMNGYELCKHIKQVENTKDIPVILLTALSDPEDILEGLACEADSFITKPFSNDYLLAHIQQVLANWKLRKTDLVRLGIEILYAGKRRFISADQQQMLGLLLSTYEAAVQHNKELEQTQEELHTLNEHLEDKVKERTASLSAEIEVRKQTEEALAASEAELRALFAGMMDVVIVYDNEGRYVKIAPTNPTYLYLPPQDMLGKTVHEVLPKEEADYIISKIQEAIQSGQTVDCEYALPIGGEQVWFTATATRLTDKTVIWVAHDITDLKQTEDEIRQRMTDLEMLYSSSLVISQTLQPQEIGQHIIKILLERVGQYHNASLRLYHSKSETIELLAFDQPGMKDETERLAARERFQTAITKPGQGMAGWVIQHGQPVYCGDVTKDPRYLEVWPGIRSGMYLPMKVGERTIGCLSVESEKGNAFSETDEWLITTLAAQAASALENARLFVETSRRLKRVQALRAIDTAISSSLDLRVTFEVFLNQVISQLGVDAADVLQFSPSTQTLEYVVGRGFRTDALEHTRLRLGEDYAGIAGLEQRLIRVSDLRGRKTAYLRSPKFRLEGFETGYCAPLIAKNQLKGVLEIFHRSPLAPDQEWLEFLETLAGQAAIAIDNINLFDGLQRSNLEQSLAYDATIEGWSRALDLRDKETEGHTQRVTEMTMRLANAIGMPEDKIIHMRRGALLHDIGKMGIPDQILLKPGPLSDEEWEIMRKHPFYAFNLLSPIAYLQQALDIPYCHHEKWDGSGYPRGLKGERIPLAARIFAIVDVYDALTSDRPYRKAWTKERTLEHIKAGAGSHFDPEVVKVFLRSINDK